MAYTTLKDALTAFERQVVSQIHSSKADYNALNTKIDDTRTDLVTEIGKIQGVEKIICTNRNNTPLGVSFNLDDSSATVHIEGALTAVNAKQNGIYFVPLASDKKAAFKKYEIYLPINGQWEKLTGSVSSGGGTTSITISDAELQAIQTETK